jgi:hypothetical protein
MAEMCQQMASRVTLCAYCLVCLRPAGRDGADGIVTRCGLDGPGIESPWGGETGQGAQQPSCTMGTGSSPGKGGGGLKWPERGVDHPPPLSAEIKERVELYLYCASGPLWPVIGWQILLSAVFEHFTSVSPCCQILNFHRGPVEFKKLIFVSGMKWNSLKHKISF